MVGVPSSARVMVFRQPDLPLQEERVPIPQLRSGEALVAVLSCTLCGSDLHTLSGRRSAGGPTVLGHEIVGSVIAVADEAPRTLDGKEVRVGERVVWSLAVPCGACRSCKRGLAEHCVKRYKYGHEPFSRSPLSGGLSEVVLLVPGTVVERVPTGLPDAVAATASCAAATVAAALRVAAMQGAGPSGARVLVLGCGLLGLTAIALCRDQGAESIAAMDTDPTRASRALTFGADEAVVVPASPAAEEAPALVERSFDLVLELSGSSSAAQLGLDVLGIGGSLVLVGAVKPVESIALNPETAIRRRISIHGVHNYLPVDLREGLALLARSAAPFASLLGPSFALDEVLEAVADAGRHGYPRAWITP